MLYNTEAIVIRSFAYGETHAIVTLLTPMGKVAAMAKGAKKPQSRLTAGVQLCVHGMYSIYQRTGMGTISQVEVMNSYRSLRNQLESAAFAAYFCELAAAVSEDRPHGSEVPYRALLGALNRLHEATAEEASLVARVWEAKVLRLLGASPNWQRCVHCTEPLQGACGYSVRDGGLLCKRCLAGRSGVVVIPAGVPKILETMSLVPWERLGKITLNGRTHATLKQILQAQMTEYAGLNPKSLQFLNTLESWT